MAMIEGKIQIKTHYTLVDFMSLYFTNRFEISRDCWPSYTKCQE
jgi:hypothetical protein